MQLPTLVQQYLEKNGLANPANLVWNKADSLMQDWTGNPVQQPFGMPTPNEPAPWLTEAAPYMQEQIDQMQEQPTAAPQYEHQYSKQMHPAFEYMQEPSLMENPAFISQEQEQAAGSIAKGIEAARKTPLSERIGPNANQKEKAFNRALGAFGHGMATQQSPSTSTLERISQNIYPAVEAYNANLDKARAQNIEEIKLENELRKNEEGHLTGLAAEYASADALERKLGPNHPAVVGMKRALKAKVDAQEQLTKNRIMYEETGRKRASTQLGKLQQELDEIKAGYSPGSNGQKELTPVEQEIMTGQWELRVQKEATDAKFREKGLYASNIDKTMGMLNVDDLVSYAGIFGEGEKTADQIQAMTGEESERYAKYQDALVAADALAIQVRQFYGESITPSVREALHELTNPGTWKNNPSLAKRKYMKLKSILEAETKTFKNALKNTEEFGGQSHGNAGSNDDPLGIR